MEKINDAVIQSAMTYDAYVQKVSELLAQGKVATTPINNSHEMLHYTELNLHRMHRLDKTTRLTEETKRIISSIKQPIIWLDITEGWCGDAAQVVPVVENMANLNPNIHHKLIFRDEHPDIIDAFLTDGSRSIPKLIVLNAQGYVLSSWGPRPQELQNRVAEEKIKMLAMTSNERKAYFETLKIEVQKWYNNDKTMSIQTEITQLMMSLSMSKRVDSSKE